MTKNAEKMKGDLEIKKKNVPTPLFTCERRKISVFLESQRENQNLAHLIA